MTRYVLTLLALASTTASASAQYGNYPPAGNYPNGIYGRGYGYATGQANYLQGSATVMNAYGNLGVQQQQANVVAEQAAQAKLDTQRKTFDQMKYERDNTQNYIEKKESVEAQRVRRVLYNALPAEVTSGSAFNVLLPFLTNIAESSQHGGPPVPLSQEMLKQVNVSSGIATSGVGLLKDAGSMNWPFVLRGPLQEELDPLLGQAVSLAAKNKLTPKLYNQITQKVEALTQDLKTQFHKEEIDGSGYLDGKRYLDSLSGSVALLKSPNAAKYFSGVYVARGGTVDELAMNMTLNGLKFAPSQPGDESAYYSLYSSFKAYATAAQGSSASLFRVRTPPGASAPMAKPY